MADLVLDTKVLRQRLGDISQGDLAKLAYVDQSTVSLWETNQNNPSRAATALIQQHCASCGVELAWKPTVKRAVA